MGSTADGNADPMTPVGWTLPHEIEIDRAGRSRVRGEGQS
jgi:hypothetical protein